MLTKFWLKGYSGLFLNLSSGWFGAVFIVPVLSGDIQFMSLTINLVYGIFSLILHVKLEENLHYGSK